MKKMKKLFTFRRAMFVSIVLGFCMNSIHLNGTPLTAEQIAALKNELKTARNPARINQIKKEIRSGQTETPTPIIDPILVDKPIISKPIIPLPKVTGTVAPSAADQIAVLKNELKTARNPARINQIKKEIRALSAGQVTSGN